jgi:hypothetical protein
MLQHAILKPPALGALTTLRWDAIPGTVITARSLVQETGV